MKLFVLLAALLACLVRAEIEVDEGVLVLNEENFDDAIKDNSKILVEFYAPWCGHCKSLAPEWAKAAKALADEPIKLSKVDATENNNLAEKYGIKGFPTIKYFNAGKPSDYSGGRVESEIVAWALKKTGPAYITVSSVDDLTKLEEKHDAFVLGVFSSDTSDASKKFMALASSDESGIYALTTNKAVKDKLAVTKETVVVLKNFDEKRNDMEVETAFDNDAVTEFILGASSPLIQEFSPEAAKKIFSSPINKHVLIFTDKEADYHAITLETYKIPANSFKGKALFVNVPASEKRVMDFFGLTDEDLPTMILSDMGSESGIKKYPYTGAAEAAAITTFVTDFFDGKLKPSLKSEKVTPEDTQGGVVVVKGESFKDIVINNTKDVLIEFYAPWCGHCKQLAPIWEELGEQMEANENVVIAKMDATANEIDVEGVAVKGFPTILFFKGDDKTKPVSYGGSRELEGFLAFLKENAHNAIDHDEL